MAPVDKGCKLLILYASQTGTAEAVAEELSEIINLELKLDHRIMCASKSKKEFKITEEELVIFVVSSTGDGDPPDTATKLWRELRKPKTGPGIDLSKLRFTVLGLGDTNYSHFNGAAMGVHSKCLALGATDFHPPGYADDAVGLEEVIEPWREGVLNKLRSMQNGIYVDATAEALEAKQSDHLQENKREGEQEIETVIPTIVADPEAAPAQEDIIHEDVTAAASYARTRLYERVSGVVASASASGPAKEWLQVDFVLRENEVQAIHSVTPPPFNGMTTYSVPISSMRRLTGVSAVKHAGLVELDLANCEDLEFQAGDAFGIFPQNNPEEIEMIMKRLHVWKKREHLVVASVKPTTEKKPTPTVPSHLSSLVTLHSLFLQILDVRSLPKKSFLRFLSECTKDDTERNCLLVLAGRSGSNIFIEEIAEKHLSLLDLLTIFPSVDPTLPRLLEFLTPLHPRYYSASSCPESHPHSVEFAYTVVDHNLSGTPNQFKRGVCTGWLETLRENPSNIAHVRVFPKTSHHFRMPESLDVPVILIGPGTGVAPFIGFLRHRRAITKTVVNTADRVPLKESGDGDELTPESARGLTWLFFGCRNAETDFLFKNEIDQLQEDGVLNRLTVAFSRNSSSPTPMNNTQKPIAAQGEVRYVQHQLVKHGRDINDLMLKHNAQVYVCGDAKNMAKAVDQALRDIIVQHGGVDAENVGAIVEQWTAEGRYNRDIWA
eukprot:CFRG6496T1